MLNVNIIILILDKLIFLNSFTFFCLHSCDASFWMTNLWHKIIWIVIWSLFLIIIFYICITISNSLSWFIVIFLNILSGWICPNILEIMWIILIIDHSLTIKKVFLKIIFLELKIIFCWFFFFQISTLVFHIYYLRILNL